MNTSICAQISQPTCEAIRKDVRVPAGHVVIAEKWAGSELHTALNRLVHTVVSDYLGLIDFYPSSESAVLYVSEADLLNEHAVKRKIVKLRKNNAKRPYVMAEQAAALEEQYNNLQQFAVMELGVPVLAVRDQCEAAQLLAQMDSVESGEKPNPFLVQRRLAPMASTVASCLLKVPGLGEVKAKALLHKYPSLKAVSLCGVEDLAKVVGPASAANIHRFFNGMK